MFILNRNLHIETITHPIRFGPSLGDQFFKIGLIFYGLFYFTNVRNLSWILGQSFSNLWCNLVGKGNKRETKYIFSKAPNEWCNLRIVKGSSFGYLPSSISPLTKFALINILGELSPFFFLLINI